MLKRGIKKISVQAAIALILFSFTLTKADDVPSSSTKPIYSRDTLPTKPTPQDLADYKKVLNGMSISALQEEVHHWDNKINTCAFSGLTAESTSDADLADLEEIRSFCKSAAQYNEIAQKILVAKNSASSRNANSSSSMDKVLPTEPEITTTPPSPQNLKKPNSSK